MSHWPALIVASACWIAGGVAAAEPRRIIVANGDVRIDVIAEGAGPLLVLLPSRKFRAWFRVKVSKHLFQHRYDYRAISEGLRRSAW